jgi:superfamily II DNA or RNA helicase
MELREAIQPYDYQYRAQHNMELSKQLRFKGMLLGDAPGNGKTLPAMMEIVKARVNARRFSCVVASASCLDQWLKEVGIFFKPVSS